MSEKMTDRRKWAGVVSTIRVTKRNGMSRRLYMAFASAVDEAHTRGRIYALGGENTMPVDEYNATQAACEHIFFRELRRDAE